jgi:hypothetical protein
MLCGAIVELCGALFFANNPQQFWFGLDGMPLLWHQRHLSENQNVFK